MMGRVIRVNFGDAVDDGDCGVVRLSDDDLLTSAECAALVSATLTPAAWRSLVSKGYAPKADDPGVGPVNRRTPRWRRGAVKAYVASRPGRTGRPARIR